MHIHLIRHGKTLANELRLYCGRSDPKLSAGGIAELLSLKKLGIFPKNNDIYFTSGLKRSEHTLNILYGSKHRQIIPQLSEYNFGEFEMKSHEELSGRADYQSWINDETGKISCPSGESKQDFNRRVSEGYEKLYSLVESGLSTSVLVICHGGVIACVMEKLFPDTKNFYEWLPKPGRGYTLVYTPCESRRPDRSKYTPALPCSFKNI